jgi:hypothetical protein
VSEEIEVPGKNAGALDFRDQDAILGSMPRGGK